MTRISSIIGICIIAAWLLTMGFLYRDQAPTAMDQLSSGESFLGSVKMVEKWQNIEDYMLLVRVDPKTDKETVIGGNSTIIKLRNDPTTTQTYTADFRLQAKINPLFPTADVKIAAYLDSQLNLTAFHAAIKLGPIGFTTTGYADKKFLYIQTVRGGETKRSKYKLDQPITMVEALRPAIGKQMEIKSGNEIASPVIDPFSGKKQGTLRLHIGEKETIKLNGKSVTAFKVTTQMADIKTEMWINEKGRILRRNLIGYLAMVASDHETLSQRIPSIDKPVEIPLLDPEDFANISINTSSPSSDEGNSQMSLIRNLLN